MPLKRHFYVVYFGDPEIQSCLDLIRYLSDWSERTPAHITVRGPYSRRLHNDLLVELNKMVADVCIDVHGVSAFMEKNQNTVYLSCYSPVLKSVWHKPKYPFNPHLTLYDGLDRTFANKLLEGIAARFSPFSVKARGIYQVVSVKGERTLPTTRLSIELACRRIGINIESDASIEAQSEIRLQQIFRVYDYLQRYCIEATLKRTVADTHDSRSSVSLTHDAASEPILI